MDSDDEAKYFHVPEEEESEQEPESDDEEEEQEEEYKEEDEDPELEKIVVVEADSTQPDEPGQWEVAMIKVQVSARD